MKEGREPSAYQIHGSLARAARRRDRRNQEYLIGTLTFRRQSGEVVTMTAMAFGDAMTEVADTWRDADISLYGVFRDNAFRVIGKAAPFATAGSTPRD